MKCEICFYVVYREFICYIVHLLQDASTPAAGKHIIFDSDEEDQRTSEGLTSKKTSEDSQSEDETSARSHKVRPALRRS